MFTSKHQHELNAKLDALNRSQAIIEFAPDGTILDANDNFLAVVDYALEEVKGQHHSIFVEPSYKNSAEYREFWESLREGKRQTAEYKRIGKGGRAVWIHATYTPLVDRKGQAYKVVKNAIDITERVKQLDEMEELRVRASITDLTSIVSEADLRGDILSINEKFIEVSKYSREELLGKPHNTTRHPDVPKEVFKELWSTIGRGNTFRGIIKNRAKDGTPYYVDAVIAPVMGANGKPRKYIGVRYDITKTELERHNMKGVLNAIDSSYLYAEYDVQGNFLTANDKFLSLFRVQQADIVGKPQRGFLDANEVKSDSYAQLWEGLRQGEGRSDVFKRRTSDGREVWLQGVYAAVKDEIGRVVKIVEIMTDVTEANQRNLDYAGQIEAIGKAQAVIEFNLDGTILNANANFLAATGYTLDEITGKHHGMFVDPEYRQSAEYRQFWEGLAAGIYQASEYRRFGKGNKEIWIQASYNPIRDLNGKPFKVVKYATDITEMVRNRTENERFMKEAVSVITGMATGNLTTRMEGEYQGAFADIKQAVNATVDKLIETVVAIKASAQSVNVAAGEIASGSADLSMRTEQQASSLEETAASMEQITGTVKQNSQNATNANELSTNASAIANEGGKVVEDAVGAMRNIEKSSQKISDIIGVIDEIAFQTNLLALNAAVEAARAGDAGKGFAVVASEVRALAGRSASASKEIKTLINESAGQVKTGAELVNQAGDTLKGIVGSVRQVAGIVSEIASASAEQATGIDEINAAVSQMDETTQQNAALVEENTAAAQSLLEQARTLEKLIGFFRVGEEDQLEEKAPSSFAVSRPTASVGGQKRPAARGLKSYTNGHANGHANGHIAAQAVARPAAKGSAYDGWEEF
ncbi:MAG: PAS domain S-box protein [Alphaproteobacteria bacterium]|nr:PAS domain S-box protein [Alphaproteobacteria bacterium]